MARNILESSNVYRGYVKEANGMRDRMPIHYREEIEPVLALAQVHATLATVPDEVEDED